MKGGKEDEFKNKKIFDAFFPRICMFLLRYLKNSYMKVKVSGVRLDSIRG